jgi:hypothetical protein
MTVSVSAEDVSKYNGLVDWNRDGSHLDYQQRVTERLRDGGNTFSVYNTAKRYGDYECAVSIENKHFEVDITGKSYEMLKDAMFHQGDTMADAYRRFKNMGFQITISEDRAKYLYQKVKHDKNPDTQGIRRFLRGALLHCTTQKDRTLGDCMHLAESGWLNMNHLEGYLLEEEKETEEWT